MPLTRPSKEKASGPEGAGARVDFRQLEGFVAVVERGSVSRAAASLGLSQPAVSKQIARLEEEFGVSLLVRGRTRSVLTPEGEVVFRRAKQMETLLQQVRDDLRQLDDDIVGDLALAGSSIPGDYVLPPILVRFSRRFPRIRLTLETHDTRGALEALVSRRVELAFVGVGRSISGFAFQPFFKDELVLAVSPHSPLAVREKLGFHDLAGLQLAGRVVGSATRKTWEEALGETDARNIQVPLRFGHTEAVLGAVLNGADGGIVSRISLQNRTDLVGIPFSPPVVRPLFVAHSPVLSPAGQAFLDYFFQEVLSLESP